MTNLAVKKVNTLPGILQSNTLYLVKSAITGMLEVHVTNNDASEVRHAMLISEANTSVNSITNSLDLAYLLRNTSNVITDVVDKNDNMFLSTKIYTLDKRPYPWDVSVGDRILIDAACLSGYGKGVLPLEFRSDGEVWVPYGEQILYSKFGSYASPPGSLVQAATPSEDVFFNTNSWHKIPWKLMYLGLGIRIRIKGFKNDADTGSTTFRVRLGQTSTGAYGDVIVALQTSAAASHEMACDVVARITALGALTIGQFTTPGTQALVTSASKTINASADRKVVFSTNVDNYITLSSSAANGLSGAAIQYFIISLVP